MPVWSGNAPLLGIGHIQNDITSTNLATGGALDNAHRALAVTRVTTTGANVDTLPIDVRGALPAAGVANVAPMYGTQIFERIHIFPQSKTISMIISPVQIIVEVWNAFRATAQSVGAVTITGPVGVSILTPYVTPIAFGPLQSRLYTVLVDVNGAPNADNLITWDFTGLSEPSFHILGLRLLPFTISPDWAQGIDETVNAMTDVMQAYDDTEQRMQLRENPQRSIQFVAAAYDNREAGLLMSLLWAWHGRAYGVLLWMDDAPLGADLPVGSTVMSVDTTDMTLADGVDTVILISDAFTWFAAGVQAHDAVSITLATSTDKDFFAVNTRVVPVKLGRIPDSLQVPLPTNETASTQVLFDLQTAITS